jgi:pimeloyl-ACP methyl ester carboxylesterase
MPFKKPCSTFIVLFAFLLIANLGACAITSAEDFDAHKPASKLHFDDSEMDFALVLIVGATMNHGCEIGEAFYTAAQIEEGDAASWQAEWIKMAQRVQARGEQCLADGHTVSARSQFMRACGYFRGALVSMMPDDSRFKETAGKARSLMKRAGQLMDPPLEYFEIPFEDTAMPGYFRAASSSRTPTKTLMMIGGGETFAEDLVFYIAREAHERGYNFLTVDMPGQGLLPAEGYAFRPDMYVPLMKVVDYALTRPEVDPDQLAAFGMSGGGGFVPQTAQYDKRIKAIAMSSAVVDAEKLWATMPIATATQDVVATWSSFKQNTIKVIAWRWGVDMDDIPGLVEANRGFSFNPAKVTCPALIVIGEGEYNDEEVARQQKECMDGLPNLNKKMVITPADEGASNHCLLENRSVMSQVLFDWLDPTLAVNKAR